MDDRAPTADQLAAACAAWQGGRDVGSSPIRGGARILTRLPHYFTAEFITTYEQRALDEPSILDDARTLLSALEQSPKRAGDGWQISLDATSPIAKRGIKSGAQDSQILDTLRTGRIAMPLWGVSLDPDVAASFGRRFTFVLEDEFPAIPAWVHSGAKAEEQELITGGVYEVTDMSDIDETTEVRLRWTGHCEITQE
ncbi:hypothetical protein R2Q81_07130 [Microbacterium aquimaris]|uniref:hypothetical protein n=1 Tax=Microbacterium aquimaris TaxID=459816 RepID=UPI002AD1F111|nr:hypothetical protein [Microbacterium aquimaris]MDZ8275722.1 hypothetical protein [Microbacterium aquimaris]